MAQLWQLPDNVTPNDNGSSADLTLLQGDWDIVQEVVSGQIQNLRANTLLVENDRFVISRTFSDGKTASFTGTILLNPSASPKEFDWTGTTGGKSTGLLGLYELNGDLLIIAYSFRDEQTTVLRPTAFLTSGPGAGVVVATYRRRNSAATKAIAGQTTSVLETSEQILARLQGRWLAVTQARGGASLTPEQLKTEDKVLTITGDKFQMTYYRLPNPTERGIEEGRILSFDLTKKPAEILMIFDTLKPEPVLFKGIFELQGDRLRHCYQKCPLNDGSCGSPGSFNTEKGKAIFSVEYVRAKN
ncbi:MAG: TIGR03067 domain-containing protein [Planctomycetaceae bacterium]